MNKKLMLFLAISIIALTWTIADQPARAQGTIEVLEMEAKSEFPDGIRFTVKARSAEKVDDIRVRFRIVGGQPKSAYRVAEFEPGTEVEAEAFLKSGGTGGSIPPGTILSYSFEIRDEGNNVLRTPREQFTYTDIRFEWQTLTEGLIRVHTYGDNAESDARVVMGAAQYAIERMTPVLGVEITEPFSIVSYDNYGDMIAAVPFRAQAVRERLITQGIAFTDERVLLVHHDASVEATTSQEFTHLLVAEATGHIQGDVPSWLNEGLAEYANIVEDRQYGEALQRGIQRGVIKPLWFLNTFSGSPEDIIIAYGQGTSVVYHMIDWEGEAKMAELMAALGETRDIDKALEQVYGFDVRGLDARWREDIGLEPLPTPDPDVTVVPTPTPTSLPPLVLPTPSDPGDRSVRGPASGPGPTGAETPAPTPTATPAPEGSENTRTGCGASPAGQGWADLAMLMLITGPFAALCCRRFLRRRDGTETKRPR